MGYIFDIRRRPRRIAAPVRKKGSGMGAFGIILILAIFAILANKNALTVTPAPPDTPSATPAPNISTPSATPTTLGPSPTPTPSPIPTATSTPSPEPSIEKVSIDIRILNGSGTAGQANILRLELEKQGFSIRNIAVAKNVRETTIVYFQSGKQAVAEFVAGFIPDRVLEFEENNDLAKPDDLLIVVGKK